MGRSARRNVQTGEKDQLASRAGVPHTAPIGATVHDAFPLSPTKKKKDGNALFPKSALRAQILTLGILHEQPEPQDVRVGLSYSEQQLGRKSLQAKAVNPLGHMTSEPPA